MSQTAWLGSTQLPDANSAQESGLDLSGSGVDLSELGLQKAALMALLDRRSELSHRNETVPISSVDPRSPTVVDVAGVQEIAESASALSTQSAEYVEPKAIIGLRKWQGRVLEVDGDVLTAELRPLDPAEDSATVHAYFDLDQLSPDQSEVGPGDAFYLTVRIVGEGSGLRTTTSSLRLRRLGRWSESEIEEIGDRARSRLARIQQYVD
jgi:hypothetical protein